LSRHPLPNKLKRVALAANYSLTDEFSKKTNVQTKP
jgi:hypothetical protein